MRTSLAPRLRMVSMERWTSVLAGESQRATGRERGRRTDAALAPVAVDAEHGDVPAVARDVVAVEALLADDDADGRVCAVGVRLRPVHSLALSARVRARGGTDEVGEVRPGRA